MYMCLDRSATEGKTNSLSAGKMSERQGAKNPDYRLFATLKGRLMSATAFFLLISLFISPPVAVFLSKERVPQKPLKPGVPSHHLATVQ